MRFSRTDHEDTEEGYFASISDLMIGILFIFLLMLTVFAINFRQAEHDQRQAEHDQRVQLEDLQQTQGELKHQTQLAKQREAEALSQREEAERQKTKNDQLKIVLRQALTQMEREINLRELARRSLLTTLRRQLNARGIQVVIDQRSGVLRLAGDLLFAIGSADLSDDALRTVHSLAEVMALTMPCYAGGPPSNCDPAAAPVLETVLIEGHTDHRPFNGASHFRDNDQLSTERALAVFAELRRAQPNLDSLRNTEGLQLLGVAGYGERRPLPDAQGMTEDDFRKNRRIDIRFVLTSRTSDELQRLRDQIRQAIEAP
jgi:flagellar motor protein MotB